MNILYLTSVFPRPEDGATIYTDLACELSRRGHSLTVVVADGKKTQKQAQLRTERGLEVLRVRTGNLYNVGFLKKGLATLLLSHHLKRGIMRFLKNRTYDLILYETPPLAVYKTVQYAKKRFGTSSFLMLKDIFPQNGVDLGIYKKNSFIFQYFRRQENALYRVSDKIGCMSKANMEYMKKHNPAVSGKVVFFPNTKAVSEMPAISKASVREKFHLPADKTIFVFGGNIGLPQSPDALIACAKKICEMEKAFFLAVGRGTHTEYVRHALSNADNFMVLNELKRCDYEELLSACDVGLIFLDSRFTVPNFPSRILSYMNFSLAVLACTDNVSDIKDLLSESGCGFWCKNGCLAQFKQHAGKLCENSQMREEMGRKGYLFFKERLNPGISADLLETYMGN